MNWAEVYLQMKAGALLDEAHLKEVEGAIAKYPFFAMGRAMAAKVATKLGDPRAQSLRFLASLYAPSRQHYAFFLEERMRPRVPPPPRLSPTGREGHTPSTASAEKREEKSSANDEPGPADMPYSKAFWPPLHGWVAARQTIYSGIGNRIRTQIADWLHAASAASLSQSSSPPISSASLLSERAEEVTSSLIPSPSEVASPPPPMPSEPSPLEELSAPIHERTSESEEGVASPALLMKRLKGIPLKHAFAFSPLHIAAFLQFELPLKTEKPSNSASLTESLSIEGAEVPAAVLPAPAAGEPLPTESPSVVFSPDLREQFSRSFIPLEEVEASIHLPTPGATEPAMSIEAATGAVLPSESLSEEQYTPSEAAEASTHMQASEVGDEISASPVQKTVSFSESSASAPQTYVSESPLRNFIPLEIDVEASIHLPVPEPTESEFEFIPSSPPAKVPSSTPQENLLTEAWQFFLKDLQKKEAPLAEASPASVGKELENLRREFIRQLLQRRVLSVHPSSGESEESLIDKLLRKLETLPQTPSVPEADVPTLTIPSLEVGESSPRVYTETMAKLYWTQGDLSKAIEVYEGLIQRHPEKAEYYQGQIKRIRAGEQP